MGISSNNINSGSVNNYTNFNFKSEKQEPQTSPMTGLSDSNLIFIYLKNSGMNNISAVNNRIKVCPSGIGDYNNYTEVDKFGNKIANIEYSKEGDILVQKLETKSPDGSTLVKTLKNSTDIKTSNITITDKNGKVLLSKEKSYQKLDDDKAQTIVNGEVYNISGLKSDVINIEHNGNSINIDLNKMLNPDVKSLEPNTSPDNFPIRSEKITNEEKEKLFNRIKSLGGDDLFRLSKSVEHIQFIENTIDAFFVETGKTLLLSDKDWENSSLITTHELGHAINHSGLNDLISDNETYRNVRNYEKENFRNNINMTKGDNFFRSKFLDGNRDLAWTDGNGNDDGWESNLRDETFAESYNLLNTMEIIHYDDEVLPDRMLSMLKYLPKTLAEVENLSQIE